MSLNPLDRGLKSPLPAQRQKPPGLESEMDPQPDYGVDSYKEFGRTALHLARSGLR